MSATNQIEYKSESYYEDLYVEKFLTFNADVPVSPGNSFTAFFKFHKVGRKVTIEAVGLLNPGLTVGISRYIAVGIPVEYRPPLFVAAQVCVQTANPDYVQAGEFILDTSGNIYLQVSNCDNIAVPTFLPGAHVESACFSYFI